MKIQIHIFKANPLANQNPNRLLMPGKVPPLCPPPPPVISSWVGSQCPAPETVCMVPVTRMKKYAAQVTGMEAKLDESPSLSSAVLSKLTGEWAQTFMHSIAYTTCLCA